MGVDCIVVKENTFKKGSVEPEANPLPPVLLITLDRCSVSPGSPDPAP